jgi:hypothetical protein
MGISRVNLARTALVASLAMLAAAPGSTQSASAPVARYTVDAGTISGMAAMGAGGGGIGSVLGAMSGGNQVAHELVLRLGSTRAATGAPKADHFMPAGARLGKSVPLETPKAVPSGVPTPEPGMPQGQMPQARLLLFWGCGERAGKGQPVIIDFTKLAKGQVPPGLYAKPLNLPDDWSILASNAKTYGEWPNGRDSKRVAGNASLLGAHRVTGNYAPEIAFTLADDFMPPLQPSSRDLPSGAVGVSWNALPKATGYYAWAMAANPGNDGQVRDMVWWTSSATQAFGGPMADWLSPAAVQRLVTAKTVLPASQTSCTIPAEVKTAGGPILMTNLYAYGPQADFAYPPRPADARAAWRPEWIARVRFRANAMVMHGMPGFGGGNDGGGAQGQAAPPGKPRCPGGLAGIAARAAGRCQ